MPKSDGRARLYVNYRSTVNPKLMDVSYPLPMPEDLLTQIKERCSVHSTCGRLIITSSLRKVTGPDSRELSQSKHTYHHWS